MIKEFLLSIKGKITVVIFLIIILLSGFAIFVFLQNLDVKKRLNDLYKHNEPTLVLHFVGMNELTTSYGIIYKIAFIKDTSERAAFIKTIESFMSLHKIIHGHCDTLGIKNQKQHKDVVEAHSAYVLQSKEIFDLIDQNYEKIAQNNKVVDTILKSKIEKINGVYWSLYGKTYDYFNTFIENKETHMKEMLALSERLTVIILIISFLIIFTGFLMWKNIYSYISYSIKSIVARLQLVAKGELTELNIHGKDEIAQIFDATNTLVGNLKNASVFAQKVGTGNFEYTFLPTSEKDELGHSLVNMRNELQKFKIEDDKRFWINKGLAIFADVIRQNNSDINILADRFLAELINYTDSNQGAIYINVIKENEKVEYLEMLACYAYNKKKHIENTFAVGEGLVGQTYKEKQIIHITEIPEDYIKITSGLGESLPNTLLFVPLMIEQDILGIVELAAFANYPAYKIEFIQKVCDSLASVLLSSANASKMKTLIDSLQLKSEQMHAQEEELRQNMEELMATQEETMRKEEARLKNFNDLMAENAELKNKLNLLQS